MSGHILLILEACQLCLASCNVENLSPTSDPTPKELLKTSSVSLVQTALKLGCSYAHNGRGELSGVFAPKFMLLGRSANSRRYFSHKMLKNWIWGSAAPLGAGLQAGLCQPRAPPPSFHNQQWTLLCLLQSYDWSFQDNIQEISMSTSDFDLCPRCRA